MFDYKLIIMKRSYNSNIRSAIFVLQ